MSPDVQPRHTPCRAAGVGPVQKPPTRSILSAVTRFVRAQQNGRAATVARSDESSTEDGVRCSRRELVTLPAVAASVAALWDARPASAVQGYTAGRIPGLSNAPDSEGFFTYQRPTGKSGGHGVGWSEIPPYSFRIPEGWQEEPVSIADLGGTEIDLRFGNKEEGELMIVVAPILRFSDVGNNADLRIDELGPPEKILSGFAPELFGRPVEEGDVLETAVSTKRGIPYYYWDVKPHNLVTASAFGNRVFILSLSANARQWRKGQSNLKAIQESFMVNVA